MYFSWSRPDEIAAPLGVLDNRFASLFESRRIRWPELERFSDPNAYDQGIAGFIDNILLRNFDGFAALAERVTGAPLRTAERRSEAAPTELDARFLDGIDTLIVVSFDSQRTAQEPSAAEVATVRAFLDDPKHTLFISPHHEIGVVDDLSPAESLPRQELEFRHHGDPTIPPQQRFGGFARALLEKLGLPVRNRFGLHPARNADGSPAPLAVASSLDRFGLLEGVTTFNLHPHLPHFEPAATIADRFDVLTRQSIDRDAPPHPFTQSGRFAFDSLLQAKAGVVPARFLICDATIWSSTTGGLPSLERFWTNVVRH